jgi:multicomponent Na+:H+ antiporter subunit B
MVWQLDLFLLVFIIVLAILSLVVKDLLLSIILLGGYSFFMALIYAEMGAVDVSFTEASVGAGVSTIFMIVALYFTARFVRRDVKTKKISLAGLILASLTALVMIYVADAMPDWGNPQAPAHLHISDRYIEKSQIEMATPNMVTTILADYRGYDTLGETTVIFIAGIVCLLLLGTATQRLKHNYDTKI